MGKVRKLATAVATVLIVATALRWRIEARGRERRIAAMSLQLKIQQQHLNAGVVRHFGSAIRLAAIADQSPCELLSKCSTGSTQVQSSRPHQDQAARSALPSKARTIAAAVAGTRATQTPRPTRAQTRASPSPTAQHAPRIQTDVDSCFDMIYLEESHR